MNGSVCIHRVHTLFLTTLSLFHSHSLALYAAIHLSCAHFQGALAPSQKLRTTPTHTLELRRELIFIGTILPFANGEENGPIFKNDIRLFDGVSSAGIAVSTAIPPHPRPLGTGGSKRMRAPLSDCRGSGVNSPRSPSSDSRIFGSAPLPKSSGDVVPSLSTGVGCTCGLGKFDTLHTTPRMPGSGDSGMIRVRIQQQLPSVLQRDERLLSTKTSAAVQSRTLWTQERQADGARDGCWAAVDAQPGGGRSLGLCVFKPHPHFDHSFCARTYPQEGSETYGFLFNLGVFITPVAGLIFETKNRAIFLERIFGRGITAREQVSRAVILEKF